MSADEEVVYITLSTSDQAVNALVLIVNRIATLKRSNGCVVANSINE